MTEEVAQNNEPTPENNTGVDFGGNKYRHENGLILGKFKSEEDVIKSYTELERKQSSKIQVPDKYEIALAEEIKDKFILDNSALDSFYPLFKEAGISNDAANKIIDTFVRREIANEEARLKSIETELGNNKEEIFSSLRAFASKLGDKGESFLNLARNAEEVKLLNEIVGMTMTPTIPTKADIDSGRTSESYFEEAFNYQKEHALTISMNKDQQDHYNDLLNKAAKAKR